MLKGIYFVKNEHAKILYDYNYFEEISLLNYHLHNIEYINMNH